VTFDGLDFNTVSSGKLAYYGYSSVTTTCLEPGELGLFYGISGDISQSFNSNLSSISYGIRSYGEDDAELATDGPEIISSRIVPESFGYTSIAGTVEFGSNLRNYMVKFFPRDCGLILEDHVAFPGGSGANIYRGDRHDFETNGHEHSFGDFIPVHSWISNEPSHQPVSPLDADANVTAKRSIQTHIRSVREQRDALRLEAATNARD